MPKISPRVFSPGCWRKRFSYEPTQQKGKFRSFLLNCLKDRLADAHDYRQALKRGGGSELLPLNEAQAEAAEALFQTYGAQEDSPNEDRLFERDWAETLVAAALIEFAAHYRDEGKRRLFEELKVFVTGGTYSLPTYSDLSERLGVQASTSWRGYPPARALPRRVAGRSPPDRRKRGGSGGRITRAFACLVERMKGLAMAHPLPPSALSAARRSNERVTVWPVSCAAVSMRARKNRFLKLVSLRRFRDRATRRRFFLGTWAGRDGRDLSRAGQVLHREVALKVIEVPAKAEGAHATRERFLREARAAAACAMPMSRVSFNSARRANRSLLLRDGAGGRRNAGTLVRRDGPLPVERRSRSRSRSRAPWLPRRRTV